MKAFRILLNAHARAYAHEKRRGWGRKYPDNAMLDDNFKLHPAVKKALTTFKKTHPYKISNKEYIEASRQLFARLSQIYGIPCPQLFHSGKWEGPSGNSYYTPHRIIITGRRSVITLLHEYAHARGYGEQGAIWWSTNIFKLIWPKLFANLRAAKNLPYKPKEIL